MSESRSTTPPADAAGPELAETPQVQPTTHDPAIPETVFREPEGKPVLAEFWDVVKRIPAYGRLILAMSRDPEIPAQAKASLAVGGTYLVSPIDLIPGIIPVVGQIDDLYVVLTALQVAIKASPPEAVSRHLAAQGLQPTQIDHDLAVIRRLAREGIRRAISLSGKVAVAATRRAAQLSATVRAMLPDRGTHPS